MDRGREGGKWGDSGVRMERGGGERSQLVRMAACVWFFSPVCGQACELET